MITFLVGTDIGARNKKRDSLVALFVKKAPGAPVYALSAGDWSSARFAELVSTRGFFDETHLVIVRDVLSNKELRDSLFACAPEIRDSAHGVLFVDDSHDKEASAWVKKFKTADIFEFEAEKKKGRDFDPFSLGSAVVARDKKQAWVLYQEALRKDISPEELFGPLLWKVKDTLVKYGKTRAYTEAELAALSRRMVAAFHESHRGGLTLDLALERLLLTL